MIVFNQRFLKIFVKDKTGEMKRCKVSDSKRKIPQKEYLEQGRLAIVDQGQEAISGYTDNENMMFAGALPLFDTPVEVDAQNAGSNGNGDWLVRRGDVADGIGSALGQAGIFKGPVHVVDADLFAVCGQRQE